MLRRIGFVILFSLCVSACASPESPTSADGGTHPDSGALLPGWMTRPCTSGPDCDDAIFCNGTERCAPTEAAADARGCVVGTPACAGACDEIHDACVEPLACEPPVGACRTDADCGPYVDVCAATARCDGTSPDADARGCVSIAPPTCAHGCDPEVGCLPTSATTVVCQHDLECGGYCTGSVCDPGNPSSAPNGCRQLAFVPSAVCAAMGLNTACCEAAGAQARGCYNPNTTACASPFVDRDADGYEAISAGGSDCDDYDANAFPGNLETCDALGHDEDCDPATVSRMPAEGDADGDGVPSGHCRNVGPATDVRTSFTVYQNGVIRGADCDDDDPSVSPFAPDLCNARDDDCDGTVDELVRVPMYVDRDGDGYGDPTCTFSGCGTEAGYVRNAFDCADHNPALVPGTGTCLDDSTLGICASGAIVPTLCGLHRRCVARVDGTGQCERDDI